MGVEQELKSDKSGSSSNVSKMAVSQDDPIIELKGIVIKLTNKVDNINKQLGAMKEHSSSDRPTMQACARP